MKNVSVKFCGMKTLEDALYAISLGVSFIGFVLDVSASRRSVSKAHLFACASEIKKHSKGARVVAVTVDKTQEELDELADNEYIDILQLHGKESPEVCAGLKKKKEVWKAVSDSDAAKKAFSFRASASRILLDTGSARQKASGTSGAFNAFAIFAALNEQGIPLVLSGGLDAQNITTYLERLHPEIIDVSRGIENAPGEKSKEKMGEFMERVLQFNKSSTLARINKV